MSLRAEKEISFRVNPDVVVQYVLSERTLNEQEEVP